MLQINVKIIADSINVYTGNRLTTFEVDYPRFIHSEVMTHREFSRNAQSSRAVPVANTIEVNKEWVMPLVWGRNKSGMSSAEVLNVDEQFRAENLWNTAAESAFRYSDHLAKTGLHKQWANRITEPFSRIKVIITSTERGLNNFFWLRQDADAAQPEIVELANQMKKVYDESKPVVLKQFEWHLPYVQQDWVQGNQFFYDSNGNLLHLDEARKISASCCAQVSYRKLNDTKEKAIEIFERLFSGPKPHLSPVEHQATPIVPKDNYYGWEEGITHKDRNHSYWSGNLEGFIQYRQLFK